MSKKPLLVGMNNPVTPGGAGQFSYALWPDPPGCTGHRLWFMLFVASNNRVSQDEYAEAFDRTNLVEGPWNLLLARDRAAELVCGNTLHGRQVVLLGAGVRDAFGHEKKPPLYPYRAHGADFWQMPHPSGRNP